MKLPTQQTLYQILLFVLFGAVILGILFDTNFN